MRKRIIRVSSNLELMEAIEKEFPDLSTEEFWIEYYNKSFQDWVELTEDVVLPKQARLRVQTDEPEVVEPTSPGPSGRKSPAPVPKRLSSDCEPVSGTLVEPLQSADCYATAAGSPSKSQSGSESDGSSSEASAAGSRNGSSLRSTPPPDAMSPKTETESHTENESEFSEDYSSEDDKYIYKFLLMINGKRKRVEFQHLRDLLEILEEDYPGVNSDEVVFEIESMENPGKFTMIPLSLLPKNGNLRITIPPSKTSIHERDSFDCDSPDTEELPIQSGFSKITIGKPHKTTRLAVKLKEMSPLLKKAARDIYELKTLPVDIDNENHLAKYQVACPRDTTLNTNRNMSLLLVGGTGSGKSTMINAIANFVLGVEWEDEFRFKIKTEKGQKKRSSQYSQTKWINSYIFQWQEGFRIPHSLTVIDTPGFGDTDGIEEDKRLVEKIKALFEKKGRQGMDQLHAIGIVAQAAHTRLTAEHRYIYTSLQAIFGKDMKDNFFLIATFADSDNPNVLTGLKAARVVFKSHFGFNNSALYAEDDDIQRLFWERGIQTFHKFFKEFGICQPVTLTLTREVLRERENLQSALEILQPLISRSLQDLEELKEEYQVLKKHNFKFDRRFRETITVTFYEKQPLGQGEYATNCNTCEMTCHYPCPIQTHGDLWNCAAMKDTKTMKQTTDEKKLHARCMACPQSCKWISHRLENNIYRSTPEKVTRTSEELSRKYAGVVSQIEGETNEQAKAVFFRQWKKAQTKLIALIDRAHKSHRRLQEIALKPDPLSMVDYIEELIALEEQEQKAGYPTRIQHLQAAKSAAEWISRIKDPNFDPMDLIKSFDQSATNIDDWIPDDEELPSFDIIFTFKKTLKQVYKFVKKLRRGKK
ncbi:unnamed protein product [Darwinula stevensoni]|uniref:AIG1-type G domain-containing protein n=1 Tax=Darwinula stevensoni TaxID=69355 RepID=A0A7R9FS48_9CRUS|nr:unnamed protein product [Darwinula stevensoni]CAG0903048.1 unnamed protein product [Darwinula stevensoni]